jgi:ABC-type Fe3+ transport system substrate-binding protein
VLLSCLANMPRTWKDYKMPKFGQGVTDKQLALARQFERAGLTSYSQAVKAFQRQDNQQIEEWKKQLAEKNSRA